ncbi:protein-export chaperone SecB [Leuconostoc suionicum]|uniref:protein-export chaperone SecB n=1 Tax=Leuconostoc suionicum TaxID=1511761 RepID=UPI001B8C4D30|nr:protein-export chaperone SecB [Leuconostoc suionicum]MBS1007804.1 protein-export chaperone SecB [Leuconostoc suionicum]
MAVLKFNGYNVDELTYIKKTEKEFGDHLDTISPLVKVELKVDEENGKGVVSLDIRSRQEDNLPFNFSVIVIGKFSYSKKEDINEYGLEHLLQYNAVAILYPYARSLVSNLTSSSNEFPGLILPTVNVAELLSDDSESKPKS